MRWRPLTLAAPLSVLLLLGILLMWAASHENARGVKFGPLVSAGGDYHFHATSIQSHDGGVWLQTLSPSTANGASSNTHLNLLGVAVTSGDALVAQPSAYIHSIAVRLPYWFFACIASVLPTLWLRDLHRRRRRLQTGHCPGCGFDIRITPDSCPECGLVIVRDTAGDNDSSRATCHHLRRAPL